MSAIATRLTLPTSSETSEITNCVAIYYERGTLKPVFLCKEENWAVTEEGKNASENPGNRHVSLSVVPSQEKKNSWNALFV